MNFPRREEATNKELILTIIEIQGYLSRYGRLHTNWHETLNEVIERLEQQEREDLGDYPDTIHNQSDNMTGSMNL